MGDVTVDRDFVRVGTKSYAINKINSVEVRTKTTRGSRTYKIWWAIAAVMGLFLLIAFTDDNPNAPTGI